MSLSIKFASSDIEKKAKNITFKDTTGAYNSSTNPGGYGSANGFVTPTVSFLFWRFWTATAITQKFLVTAKTALLNGSGLIATPDYIGLAAAVGEVFDDGIHQVQYVPLNDSTVSATFTNGSKNVTLSTTAFDINTKGLALAAFVAGLNIADPDDKKTAALEIDWTATQTTSILVLKTAYTGTTLTSRLWFGPLVDLKILVNKIAEACLASSIGKLAETDCECSRELALLNKLLQWRFAADIQYDCDDFDGADTLIKQIGKYCADKNCIVC